MVQDNKLTIAELDPSSDTYIMDSVNKWLSETYGVIYNKSYRLYIEGDEYSLYLHMNNQDRPLILAGEFSTKEAFIDYVKKEMQARKLFFFEYFIAFGTDKQ
jgi:hypothetical protein